MLPAAEVCSELGDEDCDGEVNEEGADCPWLQDYVGHIVAMGGLAADANGNIAFTAVGLEVDFGAGVAAGPGHLVKIGPDGAMLWSRHFNADPTSVAFDGAGNVIFGGRFAFTGDLGGGPVGTGPSHYAFVGKRDPAGNLLWVNHYDVGYEPDFPLVATDSTGAIYLAGKFGPTITVEDTVLTATAQDPFVLKLDPDGQKVWIRQLGSEMGRTGALAVDVSDNVFLGGGFAGDAPSWGLSADSTGLTAFLAKLQPDGTGIWADAYASSEGLAVIESISVDPAGNPVVAGVFNGQVSLGGPPVVAPQDSYDRFVARFAAGGMQLWSANLLSDTGQTSANVAALPTGDTILGAGFIDTITFGGQTVSGVGNKDVVVAKLKADGNLSAATAYGDSASQTLARVIVDGAGSTVLVGNYEGVLNLGFASFTTAEPFGTLFVAKLPK